ncbi:hypothetical protein V6N12_011362 [Hibiscus sabdariffa]|uniref:Uncharacterized protein n=1 Tax=Hibiscus sabdariffa TaxID=183260 RepID=A0ABR2AB10_9ROSI
MSGTHAQSSPDTSYSCCVAICFLTSLARFALLIGSIHPNPNESSMKRSASQVVWVLDRFSFVCPSHNSLVGRVVNLECAYLLFRRVLDNLAYSSMEEAIETRSAIYNLQWPPNGGRVLVAEFVDPHEFKILTSQPQRSVHQQVPSPWLPSDEPDSPVLTLDDLFWKTKATLKINHLPL